MKIRDLPSLKLALLLCCMCAGSVWAQGIEGRANVIAGGFGDEFQRLHPILHYEITTKEGMSPDFADVSLMQTSLSMDEAYLDGRIRVARRDGKALLRDVLGYSGGAWYPGSTALQIQAPFTFRFKYGALSEHYNEIRDGLTMTAGAIPIVRLKTGRKSEVKAWLINEAEFNVAKLSGDRRQLFTCLNQIYSGIMSSIRVHATPVDSPDGLVLSDDEELRLLALDRLREAAILEQLDWGISLAQYVVAHAQSNWTSRANNHIDPTIQYFVRLDALGQSSSAAVYAREIDHLERVIRDFGDELFQSGPLSVTPETEKRLRSFSRTGMIRDPKVLLDFFDAVTELSKSLREIR